jgi:pimeloyl-ACP methyl ester carboxylesterase
VKPLPELPGARHSWVDAGGVRLHVAELGPPDGEPLLLVHGWPQHWWCWNRVGPQLAEDRRVVMPDLRGHGWSEAPAGGYEKDSLADDLVALLDALGIERVDYVGHDWGAYVGFLVGVRYPERVRRILNLGLPPPWLPKSDRQSPRRLVTFLYQLPLAAPLLGELLINIGGAPWMIQNGSVNTFTAADLEPYAATWTTRRGARVSTQMYRSFVLREIPPIMKGRWDRLRLEHEARLVIGEEDPVGGTAPVTGHEGNAPRLVIEKVPGAGHFLPEERPDVVVAHARELFS